LEWAVLVAAVALVVRWGQPAWAGPRVPTDPGGWSAWLTAHGAVPAAVAVVRVITLGVGIELAAVVLVAAVARATAWHGPLRLLHAVVPPLARRLVDVVAGVTVLSLAVPPAGAAVSAPGARSAVVRPIAFATATAQGSATTPSAAAADQPDREVIELDDDPAPVPADAPAADPGSVPADGPTDVPATAPTDAPTADGPTADAPAVDGAELWEVRPGEHFWSIAEEVLATSWGRPATEAEVAPYWAALVEANRDRLAHRDDPDLVYPGQVMALPPVPPAPAVAA
jgi:hypothetical protein